MEKGGIGKKGEGKERMGREMKKRGIGKKEEGKERMGREMA